MHIRLETSDGEFVGLLPLPDLYSHAMTEIVVWGNRAFLHHQEHIYRERTACFFTSNSSFDEPEQSALSAKTEPAPPAALEKTAVRQIPPPAINLEDWELDDEYDCPPE